MPVPMPIPGSMPVSGPIPMNIPAPGRGYYPPYMGQPMPMGRPIPGPNPMMPMIPQGGPGIPIGGGGVGGTSIIVEPLVILPMGIGAATGTGVNSNPYYGANGAYPTYSNYNPYNTSMQQKIKPDIME
ncbi:tetra-peptide repeat homeobox protein 1-like [Drosophila ficusphila]|uniref:tetra-peptide repeat homeobox protein 1-like n=1 Tax=Drosophila ficusphila TaxID=30025 RepID=UPI001C8A57F8|nr:tetra-peptide repeat homeobox protein 1-like [Drosophila ficusphila]